MRATIKTAKDSELLKHSKKEIMPRTIFFDQIRVVLTILVILHHTAIMFGAPGGWYIHQSATSLGELVALTFFVSINQSFFMGFFFLLAGYFTKNSYDRKGALLFLQDRFIRLAIPTLVYGFILGPMTVSTVKFTQGKSFLKSWIELTSIGYFNIGPLWFAFALLLFSCSYAFWRVITSNKEISSFFVPNKSQLLYAAFFTGVSAFFLRLWVPLGQERMFMQIGYFASYSVLFIFGCAVSESHWLENFDIQTVKLWRRISLFCTPLLFIYGTAAGAFKGIKFDTSSGWTMPVIAYALWEPFVAWGIIFGMLWYFRNNSHKYIGLFKWSQPSYAAYIVHPLIVVLIGSVFMETGLPSFLCVSIVGILSIIFSFIFGSIINKIPGAKRVL